MSNNFSTFTLAVACVFVLIVATLIVIFVVPALFNVYKGYCEWAWWDNSCNGLRTQMLLERSNNK